MFKAIRSKLPQYDYIYLGDSARAPYGNHSHEVIYSYVKEAVDYLFKQDCKLIILACNTASAQALRQIQQEYLPKNYPDRRVLGIIFSIAEHIAQYKDKRIGVIGTRATVTSGVYTKEIVKNANQEVDVVEKACPLLVPMIEEGFVKRPELKKVLRYYLRDLKKQNVDVLINGCSHYQLIHDDIQQVMGKSVVVLDTAEIVANSLHDYLERHQKLEGVLSKDSTVRFLTTDLHGRFNELGSTFYGEQVQAEQVALT